MTQQNEADDRASPIGQIPQISALQVLDFTSLRQQQTNQTLIDGSTRLFDHKYREDMASSEQLRISQTNQENQASSAQNNSIIQPERDIQVIQQEDQISNQIRNALTGQPNTRQNQSERKNFGPQPRSQSVVEPQIQQLEQQQQQPIQAPHQPAPEVSQTTNQQYTAVNSQSILAKQQCVTITTPVDQPPAEKAITETNQGTGPDAANIGVLKNLVNLQEQMMNINQKDQVNKKTLSSQDIQKLIAEQVKLRVSRELDQKKPPKIVRQPTFKKGALQLKAMFENKLKEIIDDHKQKVMEISSDSSKSRKSEEKPIIQLVEKYLKISDFLEYILKHQDIFLEDQFMNVKNKDEQARILTDFLKNFLLRTQDCIDFDKTVKVLVDQDLHSMLIEELFEQTDASFKSKECTETNHLHKAQKGTFQSARFTCNSSDKQRLFRKSARIKLLVQLINQSIQMKRYNITFEVTKKFLSDLLKSRHLPIFDTLFNHLQDDTSRYEAKIGLIFNCIPLMNRNVAARLMKIIEGILKEPASNSILKKNINPLRVGLMLYRVIDEIQKCFAYSEHSSNIMKEKLCDQLVNVLEMYNDPEELMFLVEQVDFEGNDCFWYLDEYDLYHIMDCRIMDRVIQKKWIGKFDINATIMDYSTAYTLMRDKYMLFATDWVFQELNHEMLTFDRSDKTHGLKFNVWLHSMLLRSRVDAVVSFLLTIYFQLELNAFNQDFQITRGLCDLIEQGPKDLSDFNMQQTLENQEIALASSADYLKNVMFASIIHLLFPVNVLMEWFFIRQTKRKPSELDINFLNELTLFIASLLLYTEYYKYLGVYDEKNLYSRPNMTDNQLYISNILWQQKVSWYPLEYMLAILAGNCWIKLLLRLRVTQQFGPLFKVIQIMIIDLGIFLVLWIIILIMFSSSACMIFGQLKKFENFFDVLFMYLEYSLGEWDIRIYCEFNKAPNLAHLCTVGKIYTTVFLLANMVLLLNLVIAILSSTFAYYEDKKLGLYYEVLVSKFPSMEYCEKYGAVVCAQPPFNMMILPFWWISILPWSEEMNKYRYHFNLFLCHLLYLPLALTFTLFFTFQNIAYVPIAYLKHTYVLIKTLSNSDETMDEMSEKVQRLFTIIKFIFAAPFLLFFAVPIDMAVFMKNLYSTPVSDMNTNKDQKQLISMKAIDILQQCCQEVVKERREETGIYDQNVNFVMLNKKLQQRLSVQQQIQKLIFDYHDDSKFITDPVTKSQRLSPQYLNGLREFNLLKTLVANCADKTGLVDTDMLKSLIDQVELRQKMLVTLILTGDLELGKDDEQMWQDGLIELCRAEPKNVENKLAQDGQVLDTLRDTVNGIKMDITKLTEDIKKTKKVQKNVRYLRNQIDLNHQLLLTLIEEQRGSAIDQLKKLESVSSCSSSDGNEEDSVSNDNSQALSSEDENNDSKAK